MAARADRHLRAADRRASTSPFLRAIAPLPVVGSQVAGIRDLTAAGSELGALARSAGEGIQTAIDDRPAGGPGRLAVLETALDEIRTVDSGLRSIEVDDDRFLLPPLSGARRTIVDRLAEAPADLADAEATVLALQNFFTGPGDYLVLGANNAEMGGGGGIPLSVGTVHVEGGEIDAGDFVPGSDLLMKIDRRVPVPANLISLYHDNSIGHGFRGTAASPNFPAIAPIYQAMAAEQDYPPIDGVLMVDVVTLEALIAATGPIDLDGVTYDADNIADEVLYRNYLRFATPEVRDERTDLQSRIALEVFDALSTRDVSVTTLAAGLVDAAQGRHLLAWSDDPDVQATWEHLGIDGRLRPDGLYVGLENAGGNKIDYFIDPDVTVDVRRAEDEWQVRVDVTIENTPRAETSRYIEGSGKVVEPGVHRVKLNLYAPGRATNLELLSADWGTRGSDGPMQVGQRLITIPKGDTGGFRIAFTLPADIRSMTFMPSGRLRPVKVHFRGDTRRDARPFTVEW